MIIVNAQKCPQNHPCPSIAVCPKGAISQLRHNELPVIDPTKCIECGICMAYCPKGAFERTLH